MKLIYTARSGTAETETVLEFSESKTTEEVCEIITCLCRVCQCGGDRNNGNNSKGGAE